ncbi:unnamed protein product, partial [Linum tenue]
NRFLLLFFILFLFSFPTSLAVPVNTATNLPKENGKKLDRVTGGVRKISVGGHGSNPGGHGHTPSSKN